MFINSYQLGSDFPLSANAGHWQQFAAVWNSDSSTNATISIMDINLVYVGMILPLMTSRLTFTRILRRRLPLTRQFSLSGIRNPTKYTKSSTLPGLPRITG